MIDSRENLIRDLVADLRPVSRPGRIGRDVFLWLVLAGTYSVLITVASGPVREGAVAHLLREPPFAFETLLTMLAIASLAYAALHTAIPGAEHGLRRLVWPLLLVTAWCAVYLLGIWHPAHPVSTAGSREHCVWQAVLFSVPSSVLMLWMARRLLPLRPRTTGMLAGAASAAILGALMQFACMYEPEHILMYHIGPVFIMGAIGFVVGPWALTARPVVPRSRGASMH